MECGWVRALFFSLVLVVSPFISGCHRETAVEPGPKPEARIEVKTTHPFRGEITRTVALPGEVKAYQQATLYAKVSGYLKTIKVDKGDPVEEGALLAEIEVPELEADSARYQAEVNAAASDYKRVGEAQKRAPDLVTPQSVDDAKAKAEIAKANLQRTETLLKYRQIYSPFSGIITRRMVDVGAFIPAATASSTPQSAALVTVSDFSTVRVQVAVPEMEAPLVSKDQPVKAAVDGLAGRVFEGKVTRYSYALDESTKTMLAEMELPNPKLELRPGMYATVRIGLERKSDALLVPIDAVLMEKANASVFTVAANKAKKAPVKLGFNDGTSVEVVSGLNADDAVILIGKRVVSDGQAVTVGK